MLMERAVWTIQTLEAVEDIKYNHSPASSGWIAIIKRHMCPNGRMIPLRQHLGGGGGGGGSGQCQRDW